jgi:hypothetical protein
MDEPGTIRGRTFSEVSGEVDATTSKRGLEQGLVSTSLGGDYRAARGPPPKTTYQQPCELVACITWIAHALSVHGMALASKAGGAITSLRHV